MMGENENPTGREARLNALFAAYRETCPDPEPSPDFMPQLWQKIEANRTSWYSWKRLAQGLITAAAAAALLMGGFLVNPQQLPSPSYLELLAADQSHDSLADTEIVQVLHENAR